MAKTPRTWTGARSPSGLKRVRQAQSRHEVLQPRRTAAKTYVAKALTAAAQPPELTIDPEAALAEALSALDRAAKVGAIHPNAAARRKSRLTLKFNAVLAGEHILPGGRVTKSTGLALPLPRLRRPGSLPARPARRRVPRRRPARRAPR